MFIETLIKPGEPIDIRRAEVFFAESLECFGPSIAQRSLARPELAARKGAISVGEDRAHRPVPSSHEEVGDFNGAVMVDDVAYVTVPTSLHEHFRPSKCPREGMTRLGRVWFTAGQRRT